MGQQGAFALDPAASFAALQDQVCACTTTSLSAPVRPAACWQTACPKTPRYACCCWKQARAIGTPSSTCPRGWPSWLGRKASTGTTTPRPNRNSTSAACGGRAAKCWADQVPSMPCATSVAWRATMTNGPQVARRAGTGTAPCPTSNVPSATRVAAMPCTATAARCMSPTCATRIPCLPHSSKPGNRRASPTTTISMAPNKPAWVFTRSRRRMAHAVPAPWLTCNRQDHGPTWKW